MSKIKLNKPFTHHSHGQEGHSMLASMNQYSVGLDTVMSCFIDKYFETFSGQILHTSTSIWCNEFRITWL